MTRCHFDLAATHDGHEPQEVPPEARAIPALARVSGGYQRWAGRTATASGRSAEPLNTRSHTLPATARNASFSTTLGQLSVVTACAPTLRPRCVSC
jgi:hypothetical protein